MVFGSNDYINNYLMPSMYTSSYNYKPPDFANLLLSQCTRQILALYSLGLRKFLLAGVGPLGCIPNQRSRRLALTDRWVDQVNQIVGYFNTGLRSLVQQLNANHPGAIFVYDNTYGALGDILNNPTQYGFSVIDRGCCGVGRNSGQLTCPIFFFAVGLAHYIVLFVTLYQRLPTNATLPKELHPVFFLFVAAPSVACLAWAKIRGDFDNGSRIAYFIALFLYVSLAVRVNFFRGIRFSLAWWAYTFPMTGASVATIRYSMEVTNPVTQALSVGLSAIATFTVTALLITTIVHAFILGDLFPDDVSIAITQKRPKFRKFLSQLRSATSSGMPSILHKL